MSRKRKKKLNGQHKKQVEAERENAFYNKLKQILFQSGCVEVFRMLPLNMKKTLYHHRIRSMRVCFENCECLPAGATKMMRSSIEDECRTFTVDLNNSGAKISLKDFYRMGILLICLQDWLKEDPFPDSDKALKLMLKEMKLRDAEDKARSEIVITAIITSLYFSNLQKHLIWIDHELNIDSFEAIRDGLQIKVEAHKAQSRIFIIDGHARPAYRVGSFTRVADSCWSSATRSMFEKPSTFNHIPIPIYIQSHAIRRMNERLDCVEQVFLQGYIYTSFLNPTVIHFNGKYLVEYIFGDKKLGYFVAEVVDNAVLLKTFLFLTNSGTPEGQKLSELSGLSKTDSKYLTIDRLSAFKQSDICENEELKSLFVRCGCKNLFDLKLVLFEEKGESRKIAKRMLQYMQLEEVAG